MSDINKTGGLAFPSVGEGFGNPNYSAPGMSLRDWLAGNRDVSDWQDMTPKYAAMMAHIEAPTPEQEKDWRFMADWWLKAEVAYRWRYADAMLAERVK